MTNIPRCGTNSGGNGDWVLVLETTPTACPQKINGDANCNGSIGLEDFEVWRQHFH